MHEPPLTGADEAELLARWSDGDRAAGQQLFRRYYKVVSRYLRNKVGGTAHGDLVQKTFLACVGRSSQLRAVSSFRAYLLGIAHHVLVDHFRAAQRSAARDPDPGGAHEVDDLILASSFAEPDAVAVRKQEHRILLAALRRLPFKLQVVLELRYWESLSDREISEVLDAPIGTVKTRLRDGQQLLRDKLASSDASPELLKSTMDTLDGWSERVRGGLGVLDEA
jgi:RNA polymerase sigma factor (sigma-70 family)